MKVMAMIIRKIRSDRNKSDYNRGRESNYDNKGLSEEVLILSIPCKDFLVSYVS